MSEWLSWIYSWWGVTLAVLMWRSRMLIWSHSDISSAGACSYLDTCCITWAYQRSHCCATNACTTCFYCTRFLVGSILSGFQTTRATCMPIIMDSWSTSIHFLSSWGTQLPLTYHGMWAAGGRATYDIIGLCKYHAYSYKIIAMSERTYALKFSVTTAVPSSM